MYSRREERRREIEVAVPREHVQVRIRRHRASEIGRYVRRRIVAVVLEIPTLRRDSAPYAVGRYSMLRVVADVCVM